MHIRTFRAIRIIATPEETKIDGIEIINTPTESRNEYIELTPIRETQRKRKSIKEEEIYSHLTIVDIEALLEELTEEITERILNKIRKKIREELEKELELLGLLPRKRKKIPVKIEL